MGSPATGLDVDQAGDEPGRRRVGERLGVPVYQDRRRAHDLLAAFFAVPFFAVPFRAGPFRAVPFSAVPF